MELIIKNKDPIENNEIKSFCYWLIKEIPTIALSLLNNKKLIKLNEFINKYNVIHWRFKERYLSVKDIILGSFNNLIVVQNNNNFIIKLNSNAYIPNTSNSYISIAKLINYGNINIPAYPIYDQVFNYVSKNLGIYYTMFNEGGN